ncbi:MAG: hypothetical protein H0T73_19695 [Ardenticatenales bacterium]|nr:hypothetical protein [Ardenticatenales bacterium]
MMGFMRFTLLLFLLFGSRTLGVQADTISPPAVLVEEVPDQGSLVSHITTLQLDSAGQVPTNDWLLSVPSSIVTPPVALHLYAGPAATFPTGNSIPEATKLQVRSILADGSWVEVEGNGQRGWVPAESVALGVDRMRASAP